jgi:uncharacterized protein (TIGR03435 family)
MLELQNASKSYRGIPAVAWIGVDGSTDMSPERPTNRGWRSYLPQLVVAAVAVASGGARPAMAQTVAPKTTIADTWQGTLHVQGHDLRTIVTIAKAATGALTAMFYSIDQGGQGIAASSISFQDGSLKLAIEPIDGSYAGTMSADGKSIAGQWKLGPNQLTLVVVRATPETAWAIPEQPKKLAAMPLDADPTFEIVTIKPSRPDAVGRAQGMNGDRFMAHNESLFDLIKYAYDMQDKQVLGAPAWVIADKYDVVAQPDIAGKPSPKQLRSMVKKLLADRFQLKFHSEQKELSVYVLSVAKTGPQMRKNESDPDGLAGFSWRGLGVLSVENGSMPAFCQQLQSLVLDRPVVDKTGLEGKWNFLLKWTPDESQFAGLGVKVPPPSEAVDAPPPLFTAIQEQIGLKLEATKTQVPVMMIDSAAKASAN